MKARVHLLELALRAPFRVGNVSLRSWPTVIVEIGEGRGECTPLPIPGWTPSEIVDALTQLDVGPLLDAPTLSDALARATSAATPPVRAAIDLALHDHFARRAGVPVWKLLGLERVPSAATSLSIGVQIDPAAIDEALAPTVGFGALKLKVGAGIACDIAVVRALRARDARPLFVDANGAWSLADAIEALPILAELGVAAVEQPVSHTEPDGWRALRTALSGRACPPLFADESIVTPADLDALAQHVDGVNLKLTKHGGLAPTCALIARARAAGLRVMLGCYLESSLGICAAAQIASLADHVDLDGHLGLSDDPFGGLTIERGVVRIPDGPGLAVDLRRALGDAVATPVSSPSRRTTFDVDGLPDPSSQVAYLVRMSADPRVAAAKERMHALLALRPGESVLDVACGHGADVLALAALVGPTGRAVGVDRSVTMIAAARAEAERTGVSHARFEVADAEALPIETASFDAVRIERSLMHAADPAKVVSELARVVRPGGRVLLAEPDWDTLLISHPDPRLCELLREAVAAEVAHPRIGRELTLLAVAAGLDIAAVDAFSLTLTSFEAAGALLGLSEGAQDSVMSGRMPPADAMRWLADLQAADARGAFVCTLTGLGVLCVRPR